MIIKEKTVSSMSIRPFFEILLANGQLPKEIEKSTGIVQAKLDDPGYRVPIKQLIDLVDKCFDVTGDPALGLHFRDYFDSTNIYYTTVLYMNCNTLLEACQTWSRYSKLLSDASEVEIGEEGENYTISYSNTSDYQADWIPEFYLANAVFFNRMTTDTNIDPVAVHFQHPAPHYAIEYQKVFRAPVLFEQEKNMLLIQKTDLLRTIPHANATLKTVLEEKANALLDEQAHSKTYQDRVRDSIIVNISTRNLNIDSVAEELGIHRTTLYRKLSQEGTSFTALLEDVRKKLALTYIKRDLSNHHIAARLGYSDPSAFQQAFKRWFGKSPSKYFSS